jgi:alkanesulfonate monooxygenase SsuD/methylene tetrahydromethanopterin reductase-like flavin-dependent oxidoreductase (luciferase family)
MKFGMFLPNFGWFGDIGLLVDIAVEAEEAGWDGFFIWDHMVLSINNPCEVVDPWIALSAIACAAKRMRIGTHITPLPRRRPWKLARESVTLDHLSRGRLILGVGIGTPPDPEFAAFSEETDVRIRAEKLDEGLEIVIGFWSGQPFSFSGKHYQVSSVTFLPQSYQKPRIPIWVGGCIPHAAPFKRAARFDGVAPVHTEWPRQVSLQELEDVLEIVWWERGNLEDYDVVICGETTGTNPIHDRQKIEPWIGVGVTWWLEDIHGLRADLDTLRERLRAGPPQLD